MNDSVTNDQIKGHFQKQHQPYGVKVCQENISQIEGFDDCRIMRDEDGDPLGVEVKTTEGSLDIGMGGWIFEDADGEHYPISQDQVNAMYEPVGQEAESKSKNGDAQPTRGPWEVQDDSVRLPRVYPDGKDFMIAEVYVPQGHMSTPITEIQRNVYKEQRANARLIAAAGTAASELPEKYDPVAAIEAINDLLRLAEDLRQQKSWVVNCDGSRSRTATKDEVTLYHLSGDILHSVRKDTTHTDE